MIIKKIINLVNLAYTYAKPYKDLQLFFNKFINFKSTFIFQ